MLVNEKQTLIFHVCCMIVIRLRIVPLPEHGSQEKGIFGNKNLDTYSKSIKLLIRILFKVQNESIPMYTYFKLDTRKIILVLIDFKYQVPNKT